APVWLTCICPGNVSFETLQQAFGPDSLGILVVKDVPEQFPMLRHSALSYASYLGNLPQPELEKLENARAKYLTGWSLGKETLKNGKADTFKGSYYANCAFYVDAALECARPTPALSEATFPDAGLYIKSRTGQTFQVRIPRDCIAFQTGEALERITAGRFKAVPHFVRGVKASVSDGRIARNTLAVFTQPNLGEDVDVAQHLTFGEFARGVNKAKYSMYMMGQYTGDVTETSSKRNEVKFNSGQSTWL
ncbi:hypothetical protein LLEC1_07973, partial [Akanthomyces lecanii]